VEAHHGHPVGTAEGTVRPAVGPPQIAIGPRRRVPPALVLLAPAVAYLLLLFFIPLGILAGVSVLKYQGGLIVHVFTLDHYTKLLTDRFYVGILLRTLQIAVTVAASTTALGYPVAYFLARTRSRWKGLYLALALAPELSGVVLRTYGWLVILEDRGLVNTLLVGWGVIDAPIRLVHNTTGVIIGLTHVLMPFAILALMASVGSIDPTLEQAAMNLGANRLRTFLRVTLPLSVPGVLGAFFLTFSISAGAYATPAILGGKGLEVMATMIYTQLLYILNWPFAAAMSVVLMTVVLLAMILSARFVGRLSAGFQ
jgi:putative spermidine/putrescine transport system permease protein